MNFIQTTLQVVEVGKGQILVRLIPLLAALLVIAGAYDKLIYHGLNDAQSMDNAQLARQILRHQGFTTEFLRPYAVAQLRDYAIAENLQTGRSRDLFPPDQFPAGALRILPDTYNPPGYPFLLAVWFHFTHPEFDETPAAISASHIYSPDRWIPLLNQFFLLLTAVLVFAMGHRLFDDRVAWLSLVAFLGTDMIWHYSLTALSTSFLMFLVTATLICALEIFCVGEACFEDEARSFMPAWIWSLVVALLLAAACLTRLHLLVLLVPLFVLLLMMPRASFLLLAFIAIVVLGLVTPWFWHLYSVCGNPLGSDLTLVLSGQPGYTGNQIYCAGSIPSYEQLFTGASSKEISGFRWHLEHGWSLLGSNPIILLFVASILHQFKRRRTRAFQWLLFGSALVLIAANNLGSASPETVGPWNIVALLFPCMLVIGSAFFFILLDRLNLVIRLLNSLIVITILALALTPLVVSLITPSNIFYCFPPYIPPSIKSYGQFAAPDEWVTTDMPWATAWYADRASLWLPDSIADFQDFHDNLCRTGVLFLTPVSWSMPYSELKTGEYKDWFAFTVGLTPPPNFPLSVHTMTGPGGPEYYLWSDQPRWQLK